MDSKKMDSISLGDRIAYQEQMLNALKSKLEKEYEYKQKIEREKQKNRSKEKLYFVLMIITVAFLSVIVMALAPYYLSGREIQLFDSIFVVSLSVLVPFLVIAGAICIIKYLYYRRRHNKELDVRDYKWRTYREIKELTEASIMTTMVQEQQMLADLTVNRQLRQEAIEHARLETEECKNDNYISADELKNIDRTVNEIVVTENPLAQPLFASNDDVRIVKLSDEYRSFFYNMQKEYLPDTNTLKCKKNEESYGNTYLVVLYNNEPVGICYGWPYESDEFTENEFTLQGIAVTVSRQGLGIGSRLLEAFEKEVKKLSYRLVGVGSASGYVEHFYKKNGYFPYSYKYPNESGLYIENIFKSEYDYGNVKRYKDGFVVFKKRL